MTIRVLVVDDSLVVRHTVAGVLAEADDIEVVGTAVDGVQGLRRIKEYVPDVVTLDVEMPRLDGLQTMIEIRKSWPLLPVIMYSTLTERGASTTLEALAAGAVDYVTKPANASSRAESTQHVRDALVPLVRLWGDRHRRGPARVPARRAARPATPVGVTRPVPLVCIGVSTGGPDALARMLPMLPADLPVPVAVVQHMPPMFTAMLAKRLDQICPLRVQEAEDGHPAEAGNVYIAPGGRHLVIRRSQTGLSLALSDSAPENSCRPAVDVLFRTAAHAVHAEEGILAAVLTGMGGDGTEGARVVRERGGTVYVQDEESSVVWGMPGSVTRAGLADATLQLDDVADAIARAVRPQPAGALS